MSLIGDMSLNFAIFVDKFDAAVSKSNGYQVAGTLAEGDPVVIDGVGVEIEPFSGCGGVDVPLVDDIVVTDAGWGGVYLVSSLKEHQETEVHISSCLVCACKGLILNLMLVI